MKEKQPDPITGEPRVFCAKHTRIYRDLADDPDMQSQMTNLLSGDDREDEDDNGDMMGHMGISNPEEDTFAHFVEDDDVVEVTGEIKASGTNELPPPNTLLVDDANSFF